MTLFDVKLGGASGHAWFRPAVKMSTKQIFHSFGRIGFIQTKQNEPKEIIYIYIFHDT